MKEKTISEGKVKIHAFVGEISRKLPVFYNPDMETNRTITIDLLNSLEKAGMKIALPMAASGIRGVRMLKELYSDKIEKVFFNDMKQDAIEQVMNNLELNKLNMNKVSLSVMDANAFLLNNKFFDYIDIDPFGSPNPFLDSAIKRLKHKGILAVTATDTAPLCGTYPKACHRKYFAQPVRNHMMHETGLRILIRKVQLMAAQYDNALIPILSYYHLHYFRIFFVIKKNQKKMVDEIIKKHKYIVFDKNEFRISEKPEGNYAGPLWIGKLQDELILKKIKTKNKLLKQLQQEMDILGSYDIHMISKELKTEVKAKKKDLLKKLNATSTHFNDHAIKTENSIDNVKELLM